MNHTLDMFIDSNLLIYGEVLQEVSHHLMSKSGAMEDIKKICSHPHAIAQCRNWSRRICPTFRFGGREYGPGSRDVPGRFLDRGYCSPNWPRSMD